MTQKNLSLIACGLILSASSAFAQSSLEAAFAAGQASGDITVHSFKKSNKTGVDAGFTAGTVGVTYETGSFNNFNAKASFRAGHKFGEVENDDYKGEFNSNSIMNEAFIKYDVDTVSATLGRQKLDFEWLTKWNEAAVVEIKSIPNTTISAGFADRRGRADTDKIKKFTDINKDGNYFIDAKIEATEGLEVNPYYFSMPKLADIYGLKVSYNNDVFGIVGHYAATKEDVSATKDGNIAHLELSTNVSEVSLAAGYIVADKTGGIGSMDKYGDNINPLDEGAQVYATDAETIYASISTEVAGVELSAIYGTTDYLNGSAKEDEKELNLVVATQIAKNTSIELLYVDVAANASTADWNKLAATITYSF